MLEKLTPEQEALMPVIRDKWIKWGTQETNTDVATIQKNMQTLYEMANLKHVPVIVCDTQQDFIDEVSLVVKNNSVGASVRASVWASVRASVWASVRASVLDSVGASVWVSVGASVRASVGASVGASVWASVRDSVLVSVRDSVLVSVRDSVWDSVRDFVGAYYWADDLAYYDYFVQIEAIQKNEKVEKCINLLADTSLGFITDKICIILRKPKVRLNTIGFLHSDEFPSVEWKDGKHSQYHLNGVKFEKELWEKVVSRKIAFADILKIEDIDQRTQAMRYGDVNAFLEHVKAEKLDTFQKFTVNGDVVDYALYEIPAGDVFTETAYYAVYNCPSTAKVYMSGVPKSTSIKESMAWKSGMEVEEWERMIPLVHES